MSVMDQLQSEEAFQGAVVEAAKLHGWRVFFIPDWIWRLVFAAWRKGGSRSGKLWAEAGFPDVILCRPPRLIVAELKRDGKYPRGEQKAWLEDLRACGIDARFWRPRDWPVIEAVLKGEEE